jgi:hypothetical protein
MNENEVVTVEEEITELTARPQGGGLFEGIKKEIKKSRRKDDEKIY